MAGEQFQYTVVVDGRGANSALDGIRERASTLGGGLTNLQDGFKNLQQKLGPAAAAISGVSAALGSNAGEAGKAVAAAGQMAAAFGAGGPLGVAIVGLTLGVNALSESWEKQIAAQDAALKAQYASVDQSIKALNAQRANLDALDKRIAASTGASEAGSFTEIKERYDRLAEAQRRIVDEKRKTLNIDGQIADVEGEAAARQMSVNDVLEEGRRLRQSQLAIAERELRAIEEARGKEQQALRQERQTARFQADQNRPRGPDPLLGDAVASQDVVFGFDEGVAASNLAIMDGLREQNVENARTSWERMYAAQGDAARRAADLENLLADSAYEHRRALREREAAANQRLLDDYVILAQGSFGLATSAASDYFAMKITGAENAEAKVAAAFLQGIGSQLVGIGTKQVFEGTGMLIASAGADPRGYGLVGLGAAAIGAGIGMGAGGVALAHVAAGGVVGQPLATTGSGIPALSSSSTPKDTRSSSSNITIVYGGSSGPTAEQGAAAVLDSMRRLDRRRGLGRS